jgi:hypothetical protein
MSHSCSSETSSCISALLLRRSANVHGQQNKPHTVYRSCGRALCISHNRSSRLRQQVHMNHFTHHRSTPVAHLLQQPPTTTVSFCDARATVCRICNMAAPPGVGTPSAISQHAVPAFVNQFAELTGPWAAPCLPENP